MPRDSSRAPGGAWAKTETLGDANAIGTPGRARTRPWRRVPHTAAGDEWHTPGFGSINLWSPNEDCGGPIFSIRLAFSLHLATIRRPNRVLTPVQRTSKRHDPISSGFQNLRLGTIRNSLASCHFKTHLTTFRAHVSVGVPTKKLRDSQSAIRV